jgi:capsular polysaccharide biosynthesis protein
MLLDPTDESTLKLLGVMHVMQEKPHEALAYYARREALLRPGQDVETRLLTSGLLDPVLASRGCPYVKTLTDVLVDTGFWAVIQGDKIYSREVYDRSMGISPRVWGRITPDAQSLIMTLTPPAVHVDVPCVLLGGDENYNHWLTRNLMKLSLTEENDEYSNLPLLLHQDVKRFQNEFLELLDINPDRLIHVPRHEIVRCDTLSVPTTFRNHPLLRQGIDWFRNRVSGHMRPSSAFSSRLYISRTDSAARKLLNEDELFGELQEIGFQRLLLGKMTVKEQIAAFAGAEIIVGPHGAGLTNMIFSPPGSIMVELTSTFTEHMRDFRFIAEQMGQRCFTFTSNDYATIGNDYLNFNCDFFVDVEEVVCIIKEALAS